MRLLLPVDVPNNRVTRVMDFSFCEVEYFSGDQAYLFPKYFISNEFG